MQISETFTKVAAATAHAAGSWQAFLIACALIVGWAALGPVFGYSDTWQLIANTVTTLITFLMVFLIQNTQNRDAQAMQLKLDELIRATDHARKRMIDAERMTEPEMNAVKDTLRVAENK